MKTTLTVFAMKRCPMPYVVSESNSFEDAIRYAVAAGGDTDTKANICGSIAESYYEIPEEMIEKAYSYLPDDMLDVITQFYDRIQANSKIIAFAHQLISSMPSFDVKQEMKHIIL